MVGRTGPVSRGSRLRRPTRLREAASPYRSWMTDRFKSNPTNSCFVPRHSGRGSELEVRNSPAFPSSIQNSTILIRYSIKPLKSHGRANRPGEPWIPPPAANSAPRGRVALPFVDDRTVQTESHEIMLRSGPFGSEIGERNSPAFPSSIQKSTILIRYSIKPLESHGRANRPGEPWIPPPAANSAPRGRVALPFVDDRTVQIESHEVMLGPAPFGSENGDRSSQITRSPLPPLPFNNPKSSIVVRQSNHRSPLTAHRPLTRPAGPADSSLPALPLLWPHGCRSPSF